ncbi:MAG: hypothetical protein OES10_06890 [Gammaproteobacteria bacterium]|nr:hypothetical protein [Gammaproteobacteria bacterium]
MTGRESLLAEIEAKRREKAAERIEVLTADLTFAADNTGYNPYDNPGPPKPLDVDGTLRRRALKSRKRPR